MECQAAMVVLWSGEDNGEEEGETSLWAKKLEADRWVFGDGRFDLGGLDRTRRGLHRVPGLMSRCHRG